MALPKEPRQKMINLMYLVLTALLALNVSAEILNAFKTVDNSLGTANATIDTKNKQLFESFEELKNDPKTAERANKWAPLALRAQTLSSQIINYIEELKKQIKEASGGTKPLAYADFNQDNLEGPTNLMADPGTKGNELKQKLTEYRNTLLNINPEIRSKFENSLPLKLETPPSSGEIKKSWSDVYFNMVPAIAAITILSKFENDIKNSEAMIVDYCHQQVGSVKFVINTYKPLIGQSSNYLMPEQELTISAGIGAYNSEAQPRISIDGSNVPLNANGVAEYKVKASAPGSYKKTVHIVYTDQSTGEQKSVDYPVTYAVGSPTGTSVSADDVKVLYIGLQNHLSISSNVGDEKIQASIDNGKLTKTSAGKYVAEPAKPGSANVHLVVEGKPQDYTFKVKTVPDPVAKVGNNKGGPMKANEFKAQFGVRADLENFVFEGVKFDVVSYTLVLNGAGFPTLQFRQVNGNRFDPVKDLIEKTRPGTTVVIDEIRAQGPGGTRKLTPIVFNLTP